MDEATAPPPGDRPVFLSAIHRSRSTLLQRVLGCHPGLVVWGEHGGLVNKLAELDRTSALFPFLALPPEQRGLDRQPTGLGEEEFRPWVSPWDPDAFRDLARGFLSQTFGGRLASGQRWGFKEIRCGSPDTTAFLAALYPHGRFVFLHRELAEVVTSSILCPWSLTALSEMGAGASEEEASQVVADCCYAATVVDWQQRFSARMLGPARATALQDTAIAQHWRDLFAFLDLPLDPAIEAAVTAAFEHRTGGTDYVRGVGRLDRAFIERQAPERLAEAEAEIARRGPDPARLRGFADRGRYSFLLGDHAMRGTRFSSMFW